MSVFAVIQTFWITHAETGNCISQSAPSVGPCRRRQTRKGALELGAWKIKIGRQRPVLGYGIRTFRVVGSSFWIVGGTFWVVGSTFLGSREQFFGKVGSPLLPTEARKHPIVGNKHVHSRDVSAADFITPIQLPTNRFAADQNFRCLSNLLAAYFRCRLHDALPTEYFSCLLQFACFCWSAAEVGSWNTQITMVLTFHCIGIQTLQWHPLFIALASKHGYGCPGFTSDYVKTKWEC